MLMGLPQTGRIRRISKSVSRHCVAAFKIGHVTLQMERGSCDDAGTHA